MIFINFLQGTCGFANRCITTLPSGCREGDSTAEDCRQSAFPVNQASAQLSRLAVSRSDAFGLHSYPATVITEEEHYHLAKTMMIREVPGWQCGYIGAKASTYDTFEWVTGPAAERVTF